MTGGAATRKDAVYQGNPLGPGDDLIKGERASNAAAAGSKEEERRGSRSRTAELYTYLMSCEATYRCDGAMERDVIWDNRF